MEETHAAAKAKLQKMDNLRRVFGLPENQDTKEGESFDKELQEQRKRDKLAEIELRQKTRAKEVKAHKKAIERKAKERKRAIKKEEKAKQKAEKQRQKV